MSLISRLGVVLGLDSADFSAGLGKAETSLTKFGIASVAIGGMVQQLAERMLSTIPGALQFADSINDISKANEIAVGTVLELSQALSVSGGSAENVTKILASFTNKVDEAASGSQKTRDKFKQLGISLKDLGNLSQEDLLRKTIDALAKIPDGITRNALAFDLLGKSIRGTDIKGFNEQMQALRGTAEGSGEAFESVGNSFDKLDTLSRQLKTDLVNNIAEPFAIATDFAKQLYDGINKINSFIETKSDGFNLWDIIIPAKGAAKADAKFVAWIQAKRKALKDDAESGKYTPLAEGNFTPSLMTGLSSKDPMRATPLSDEDKKRADAAGKIRDAMTQQSLEYQRQINFIGQVQTNESKLAIEFQKGGKYVGEQNTELGKRLIAEAKSLDLAQEKEKLRQDAIQQTIRQAKIDEDKAKDIYEIQKADAIKQAEKIKAGEDIIKAVTERRQAEKESFDLATQDVQIAAERLRYEKELAGLSDTQKQKALDFFDLSRRMKRMAETEVGLSDAELTKRQQAEQDQALAKEENARAQKTFQAGWDNAYNNFIEKAKDSAAIGANAFNSMTSGMETALNKFVQTGKISFSDLASSIIADLMKMQIKAQATSFFGELFDLGKSLIGGNGGVSMSAGAYSIDSNPYIGAYADGGNPPVGVPSLVGERGAELFVPRTAGTIIPNHSLSSMMGNQPQVVYNGTVVQNMSAIDTQSATQFLARNKQAVWASNMSAQRSLPMSR